MVVTRRTPVVQPPLAHNPSSRGAQRPRTSLAKDTDGTSKNTTSSVASASLASSSDGGKDHGNGLVSHYLLLKLFKSLFVGRTSFWLRFILGHITVTVRSLSSALCVDLRGSPSSLQDNSSVQKAKKPRRRGKVSILFTSS